MSLRFFLLAILLFASFATPVYSQARPSDPQAVAILTQSLGAAGVVLNPVEGLTATGTITYFWAGQPVQVAATLRAHGPDQFRIDASVPGGMRSVSVGRDAGGRLDADGKFTEIPLHNRMSLGGTAFPYLPIAAVLKDPEMTLSYVGLVEDGLRQLHQIRAIKSFSSEQDPNGVLAKLTQTDFFVDAQTNLIVKVSDITHPIETLTEDYPRETEFEGYSTKSAIAVPGLVRQKISGQTVWELRLSDVSFNTPLSDADFRLRPGSP